MYTTQRRIEDYLGRELTESESGMFSLVLGAVESYINKYTGRDYNTVTGEKYYDVMPDEIIKQNTREIFIDECQSISKVEIIDSEGDVTDEITSFVLYPLNSTIKSSIYFPDNYLTSGRKKLKLTGVWGYSDIPTQIQYVATALIAKLYLNPLNLSQESIEGYSRSFDDIITSDLKEILDGEAKIIL